MSTAALALARALGGEIAGRQVLAPGPGHSRKDRSLSVRLEPGAPDGFLCHSHCGDDFAACRDHVKRALGIARDAWRTERPLGPRQARSCVAGRPRSLDDNGPAALKLWTASAEPCLLMARYLASRGLVLEDDVAGSILRWGDDVDTLIKLFGPIAKGPSLGAMVALFRDIATDEPRAIGCTFLDREARKIDRRFLGPVGGAAIKLDADELVSHGLHVGEGVETCLAARQGFNFKPCWALGSKGAIGAFPVLSGIECLTILAEPDAEKEVEACAARWHAAGREVLIDRSLVGKDLNDALRGAR